MRSIDSENSLWGIAGLFVGLLFVLWISPFDLLAYLNSWSSVLQLFAFLGLTLVSIQLSINTGKVIKEQKDVISAQESQINELVDEIRNDNLNPIFVSGISGFRLLSKEAKHFLEMDVEITNEGGRAQTVMINPINTKLVVEDDSSDNPQNKKTIEKWPAGGKEKVTFKLKEKDTSAGFYIDPEGIEGKYEVNVDFLDIMV